MSDPQINGELASKVKMEYEQAFMFYLPRIFTLLASSRLGMQHRRLRLRGCRPSWVPTQRSSPCR